MRGVHFLALPIELQLDILLLLPMREVFSARLINSHFNELLTTNGSIISQAALRLHFPSYVRTLETPPFSLHCLLSASRRYLSATRLASILADFIAVEFMRRNTAKKRRAFAEDDARLRARMLPLLHALSTFLSRWRVAWLECLDAHADLTIVKTALHGRARAISQTFPPRLLLATHHMHALLVAILSRSLRPPSYANVIERSVRGWTGTSPPVVSLRALLALGGVDAVADVLGTRSYAGKCREVEYFLHRLDTTEPTVRWREHWVALVRGPFPNSKDAPGMEELTGGIERLKALRYDDWTTAWNEVVPDVLVESGVVKSPKDFKPVGAFVSELLGYDMLRDTAYAVQGGNAPPQLDRVAEAVVADDEERWDDGEEIDTSAIEHT